MLCHSTEVDSVILLKMHFNFSAQSASKQSSLLQEGLLLSVGLQIVGYVKLKITKLSFNPCMLR